jgi:SlyX protein
MMQDRLTEIEIKIAHVEHSMNELNDVLLRQQTYIDKLERGFEQLNERLQVEAGMQPDDSTPEADKPPHY